MPMCENISIRILSDAALVPIMLSNDSAALKMASVPLKAKLNLVTATVS